MAHHADVLRDIEGRSVASKAARLRNVDIDDDRYLALIEGGVERSPREGRAILQGLLRAKSAGAVSQKLLRDACACEDRQRRRALVRLFMEGGCEDELVLGVAGLTVKDGGAVFTDFFDEGGSLRTITDWLSRLSLGYRREKRKGNIDPAYDSWFSDTWDSITDTVGSITEAVSKVVESILDAKKSFSEVVRDIVEFPQSRISSLLETLIDAGETVADIVTGIVEEAYSTVSKIVRGLLSAGESVVDILSEAAEFGTNFIEDVVRALTTRRSIRDIVTAAIDAGGDLIGDAAQALVDLATNAQVRAQYIIGVVRDYLSEVPQEILDQLGDLVDKAYETARNAVEAGLSAIQDVIADAAESFDTLRSTIQGLLSGGLSISEVLHRFYQEWGGTTWFEQAVLLVEELASVASQFYEAVFDQMTSVTETILEVLAEAGRAIEGLVEWARRSSATAVSAIVGALSTLGELSAEALSTLGRAVVEVGESVTTLIGRAIDWGTGAVTAVFDGLLAAGMAVTDLLETIYEEFTGFVSDAIEVLLDIGARISDVLAAGLDLGATTLAEFVDHLIGLGRSVWYILGWIVDTAEKVVKVLGEVFDALLSVHMTLSELVAWCARRSFDLMKKGFEALMTTGRSLTAILVALLTNPSNTFSTTIEAFREIGTSIKDLFVAVTDAAEQVVVRLYNALSAIGTELKTVLDAIADAGKDAFFSLLVKLLGLAVDVIQVYLWAYNKANEYFSWTMDAITAAFDSLTDFIEAVVGIGGGAVKDLADWFAEGVDNAYEFVRDRVIQPLLTAGKLHIIQPLTVASIPFLVVAFVVLASIPESADADYLDLPDSLEELQSDSPELVHTIDPPADDHGIVVFSDLHMENQDDIDGGLGNFYKNADLVESVLNEYADSSQNGYDWTVVFNGDIEEIWIDSDVTYYSPADKVDSVVETHSDIHGILSEEFYKYQSPRRFVKLRGNHDNRFDDSQVVNAYSSHGFPDLQVYDYAVVPYDGTEILIMHGHQFDPWNCDANSDIGEFLTNFAKEPASVLNSTAKDLFGDDADVSGVYWDLPVINFVSPGRILPQYDPDQWDEKIDDEVKSPDLADSFPENIMLDEGDVVDLLRTMDVSIIMGHTHDPKIMVDSEDGNRFLANTGTSGYWEDCIWCVEITKDNVTLNGWSIDEDGNHQRKFVVALEDDGTSGQTTADATF